MNRMHQALRDDSFVSALLDSLPCGVIVIDKEGLIQAMNSIIEDVLGVAEQVVLEQGTGNALGCARALENPKGCGTGESCNYCELRKMALSALNNKIKQRGSVNLQLVIGGQVRDVNLTLNVVPIDYLNDRFAILVLEDLSKLKSWPAPDMPTGFRGILGCDRKTLELHDAIRQVAGTDAPVLLQGETGTGKELAALAIHSESSRSQKYFVPVNCGALPDDLIETELFGHVKGAFTGALRDKKGRFEMAHEGTIFLDEISELKPAMQVKLLRVLQDGHIEKVGSERMIRINARVVSATNKELEKEVAAGRFREDLYYRICVIPISLPPLRDRAGDISLLANHFLSLYSEESFGKRISLSPKALSMLQAYRWPGNVRELQNALQSALARSQGHRIEPQHLPTPLQLGMLEPSPTWRRKPKLQAIDVAQALKKTDGNKQKAAKILGVSRSTLYRFFEVQKEFPAEDS